MYQKLVHFLPVLDKLTTNGWAILLSFTSIYPTDPKTSPLIFCRKRNIENWRFWKTQFFLSRPSWIFFASSPWISVKVSCVARMSRNFDDCPGFQLKTTLPNNLGGSVFIEWPLMLWRRTSFFIFSRFSHTHFGITYYLWNTIPMKAFIYFVLHFLKIISHLSTALWLGNMYSQSNSFIARYAEIPALSLI